MGDLANDMLLWYDKNHRDLPWRHSKNPYTIWISEIMLQQTRVEAVKGYYARFLERLPDVQALAEVKEQELMKLWQGLGYYNRARNLKKAAQMIMTQYDGVFPDTYEELLKLPGIGEYTAGAIASIAFGQSVPAVDGNVYRIYTRLMAQKDDIMQNAVRKAIRNEIAAMLPEKRAGDFNQAWMDLGADICIPNGKPLCEKCPIAKSCKMAGKEEVLAYPVKKKKKTRKIEEKTIFLLEYQGKYLLQKRPDKGLLAGLWEFPSQEGKLSLEEVKKQLHAMHAKAETIDMLGSAKHIFSHIEWHMLGYRICFDTIEQDFLEDFTAVTKEQIETEYSIPSAFAAYLSYIGSK